MSKYFPELKSSGGRVKVELDLPNYATKSDLENATGVDTSKFTKKVMQQVLIHQHLLKTLIWLI